MDFFEHQADAQRRTRLLVFYYVLAVAAIVAAIYVVVVIGFQQAGSESAPPVGMWNPELLLWVTVLVGGVILAGTLFKTVALSGGGKAVAEMMGARLISPDTTDGAERRLLNVVEEMAIASGISVPPVYIIDEDGINAFAAGFKPSDAAIGVTRGCIEQLNRDELQGVIAHEFSHILNGDMRLNIRLIGVLFGILLISVIGNMVMRIGFFSGGSRRRSSRDSKGGGGAMAMMAFGLALMIIGYIGVFFGRLIKSAVSRQREFLADASAVQYTRNPDGIAGALKKIGGFKEGGRVRSLHAEEASHMFFANSLSESWFGMMATHPPLPERIRRIQRYFEAEQAAATPAPARRPQAAGKPAGAAAAAGTSSFADSAPTMALGAAAFTASIGAPDAGHLDYAAGLIKRIPENVRNALRTPHGAQAAVFCLLLCSETDAFKVQLESLTKRVDDPVLRLMEQLNDSVNGLPFAVRMPLVDLSLPALQQMDGGQYERFRQTIEELISADRKVSIFEFALMRSLMRNLEPLFGKPMKLAVRYHGVKPLLPHCLPLIALLARYGNETDEKQAVADFAAGVTVLGIEAASTPMPTLSEDPVRTFEAALDVLRHADGPVKKRILNACAVAVTANNLVTVEEAELLRAVADSLECPVPPLVPTAAAA